MNGDENYYINIYQNYVDRGELTPYMWRLGGDTNIIAGSGTGYGIFVLIGWMRIFGESLFGVRMLMVLAGLVTAWVYYLIARKWWESQEAGIAALVFGLVSTSPFYTLVGKMDAIGILSYSLLLLLHITAVRQEKKWPHFLVGAAAILTTEFHILGLMYVGALAVYYGFQYVQIVRRERKLVLNTYPMYFFLGAGLLGALYIIVHILPNPEAYFLIPSTCDGCLKNILKAEFFRYYHILGLRPIEFILILLLLYSYFKNKQLNQHFMILFIGAAIFQAILRPPSFIQYYHHLIPLLAVGVGGYMNDLLSQTKPEKQESFKKLLLFISLILLGFNLLYLYSGRYPYENSWSMPITPEVEYIQAHIPVSTVVLSQTMNFYPLKDFRNFLCYSIQLDYGLILRNEDLKSFLDRMDPKVIYTKNITYSLETLHWFIEKGDFVQITPELWVDRDLVPGE